MYSRAVDGAASARMSGYAVMTLTAQRFGIPDIELSSDRGKINPVAFAGHELIVLFCPADPERAFRELQSYREKAGDLVAHDAWILAFGELSEPTTEVETERAVMIGDPGEEAWRAFRDLAFAPGTVDRAEGAAFLFRRGGGLHRSWIGIDHLGDILDELQEPSSMHKHPAHHRDESQTP